VISLHSLPSLTRLFCVSYPPSASFWKSRVRCEKETGKSTFLIAISVSDQLVDNGCQPGAGEHPLAR
jgi:hypothetical protein